MSRPVRSPGLEDYPLHTGIVVSDTDIRHQLGIQEAWHAIDVEARRVFAHSPTGAITTGSYIFEFRRVAYRKHDVALVLCQGYVVEWGYL